MNENKIVTGVYSALVSPIDKCGNVKKDVLCSLIDWQIEQGLQGFYITGATGEGCQMKKSDRMELVDCALKHINGRVPSVVHIAAANIEEAKELALQRMKEKEQRKIAKREKNALKLEKRKKKKATRARTKKSTI